MNTIEPKPGLSNTFLGAVFGVFLFVLVQIFAAALNGNDVQVIPTLTFDDTFFGFIGDFLGYFFTNLAGLIVLIATIICYIAATYFVQKSKAKAPKPEIIEHDTSGTLRGWIIGFTSGLNFVLAYNIYGEWFNETIGLIIAVILFALGILATIKGISQNAFFQGVIGWLCWLAPMSWITLLLGLIFLVLSLIGGLLGLIGLDVAKIGGDDKTPSVDATVKDKSFTVDWETGTFFLIGGFVANVNPEKTAFNMGNIGFIHRKATADHRKHEAGHNLNLFVYGWIVHFIGAIDENIVGYGARAITERMAESHDPGSSGTKARLEVWN